MNSEQFSEWEANPTTVEVMDVLSAHRDGLVENLATGITLGADPGETAQLTAKIVGKIEGLDMILGLEYKDGTLTEEE